VECESGDVRLLDGATTLEGRLEICINNAWGTVCAQEFTSDEAIIVCAQLGFNEGVV
jgi:deleted-in-malignant-brain-tumors protein 1